MFLHTFVAVNSRYHYRIRYYVVGAEVETGTGLGAVQRPYYANCVVVSSVQQYSVLCTALCSTACPVQRSVHCTVQHGLSSTAFCALHCAAQPVQYGVLCTALCSTACPVQRSVHCTVQHSLSSTAFCALHCAAQPVHYSVLCTALCSTACPVQRSVHCTVEHSLSGTALCALHRWCSIWRLKTVTAVVRLLSYRNKKLFVWAVTDGQTCGTV